MSSLWTPEGERPVSRDEPEPAELSEEELAERMDALREQLAKTPVDQIVAQTAYQFFEIGALHLSVIPPQLDQAKLAIDALGALVDGLGERLGEAAPTLKDGLTNIRMAFVEVSKNAAAAGTDAAE
jgi:hypothetical protein